MEGAMVNKGKAREITCLVVLLIQLSILTTKAQTINPSSLDRLLAVANHEEVPTISASGSTNFEERFSEFIRPLEFAGKTPESFGLVERAYLDVFTILRYDNSCSRFFGGPLAITALNELVQQLKPRYFDRRVAIRMSGRVTTVQSNATGFSFRMFEKAEVNLGGSFYKANNTTRVVSEFSPNTRETRAVVLLHELGHMVKNSENKWVLPDDGMSADLSLRNSVQVVTACRNEIKSLSKMTEVQVFQFVARNGEDEKRQVSEPMKERP